MIEVKVPQTNANDEEVFIAEWKFKDNDKVKKGDHIVSIESSKILEEVTAEKTGFLKILYPKDEKVKPKQVIATINDEKIVGKTKELKKQQDVVFTKKATEMIKNNNLDYSIFSSKKIVKESDVIKVIQNQKKENSTIKVPNQLIILFKDSKAYHAAVFINKLGIVDLSLLGAKITPTKNYNFDKCNCIFYEISILDYERLIDFYKTPNLLTEKIIKKEKNERGWSQTIESADFILKFRKKRSKNKEDMNCIEWLVYGLELGGLEIPEDALTATLLNKWASKNLKTISKDLNLEEFKKLY